MATKRNQISYGSQGSDVTELQKLLNNNGYNLTVDGIYGTNTQDAVKDYQKKNNLTVDGVVGENTWSILTQANNTPAETTPDAVTQGTTSEATESQRPTFTYGEYTPSDTVTQAEALLNQQLTQKPGDYQSSWQTQLNDTLQQILNREKFSYDLNADVLYNQYKDQAVTKGNLAMMDTMGQAAAMTGGYGNSYAQSVGQQAYQSYLQDLNDKIPELYQLALNQYQMEGDDLYDQAALMAQQENQDYGRYRDQLGDWQSERDYLTGRYDSEREYDYGKWADNRDFAYGQFADDRAYDYQVDRDKTADEQWQAEFDEAKRQFDLQFNLKTGGSSGGGGGSSGGSSGGYYESSSDGSTGGYDNGGYSTATVKQAQAFIGVTADGMWGENSKAEAQRAGYSSLADVVYAMSGINQSAPTTTTKPTYTTVVQTLNDYAASGKGKATMSHVINSAELSGVITSAQATALRNRYT